MTIRALATDLDGTLIPLAGNTQNESDLTTLHALLQEYGIPLVFVTGRHWESVAEAIPDFKLPTPHAVICDVGTTILESGAGGELTVQQEYQQRLNQLVAKWSADALKAELSAVPNVRLQEDEKQGPFKISFYTNAAELELHASAIQTVLTEKAAPWNLISSVDPFNGDGLIDLLPQGVSKSYAIDWFAKRNQWKPDQIIFTGDSGNDLAALTTGFRAAIVANASESVVQAARDAHQSAAWSDRLFECELPATSGVLEAVRHYLRLPVNPSSSQQK